ncbi:SIMPL domain-containing protein [Stenotrophomonas rhizophila]
MKLLHALLLSSTLAMMSPNVWAQANAIPSQPHLLVKGEAARQVMPDRFGVSVQLVSVDLKTEAARRRVQENGRQVLALFERNGALADSVKAENLQVSPQTRYKDGTSVFVGISVSQSLQASFADGASLQRFLGGLQASQEVQVSTQSPVYSAEAMLRAELKAEAAAQTRESAKGLAGAYGAKVIGLYSISDVAPDFAYGVQAGEWPRGQAAPPPVRNLSPPKPSPAGAPAQDGFSDSGEVIKSGPITYTENVYAIFLIQDGR